MPRAAPRLHHGQLAPLAQAITYKKEPKAQGYTLSAKGSHFGAIKREGSCLNRGWLLKVSEGRKKGGGKEG